jgi:polygalacturonase
MCIFCRSRVLPALLLLTGAHAWGAGPLYNILDYGARNDGSALATEAFRSAIQAAKAAGGGTVIVPAGSYISGPIEMVSNLTLQFEPGSVVRFPAQRLPFTRGRFQGVEGITPLPLVGGRNLENVSITGRGLLTTEQQDWYKFMSHPGMGKAWLNVLDLLELKKPVSNQEYEKAAAEMLPMFISFMDSKNVLIEGIQTKGSAMWPIQIVYSENVVVRDVIVDSFPGNSTGNIYIDSSRYVRISNCYINSGDDGIVIKSGKDADGLRVNRPAENITITNCTVHRAHGGVAIGSETSGGVRNVVASNITCQGTQIGIRLKSRRGRGGTIEDIRFDNWTMEDVGQAISINNYYQFNAEKGTENVPEPVTPGTPRFRNIAMSNITINRARVAINLEGLPEMPIEGVRISDVIANSRLGMKAYNTAGLELYNVQVNAEQGPAFQVKDSKDLELNGVATRKPLAGVPVIRLDNCPGAIVRGGKASAGTDTFLSVGPGELKSIIFEGNALRNVRQPTEEAVSKFKLIPEPPTEGDGRRP